MTQTDTNPENATEGSSGTIRFTASLGEICIAFKDGTAEGASGLLDEERTKLNGIEHGATADQTGAEIKVAYEAQGDTNAFTDAAKAKVAASVVSAPASIPGASAVTNIVRLSQADYDALGTYDADTIYITPEA